MSEIASEYKNKENELSENEINTLCKEMGNLNVSDPNDMKIIYDACVSSRQKKVSKNGISLEDIVAKYLSKNGVNYQRQIRINNKGIIIGNSSATYHIIDFVICTDDKSIIGNNIRNYIVLSVKKTVRERWSQDSWTLKIVPRKYILLTLSDDYPSSKKFSETTYRKIITNNPKKKDDRIYKLNLDDLLIELEYVITFVDLFCGIGSFHYSLKNFECIMASDIFEAAVETYNHNYKIKPHGDIHNIDEKSIPRYDILCSGNPCQAFSNIGNKKGFRDDRGNLFYEVIRFAKYHKPDFIIFENVEGLVNHDNGNTLSTIQEKITDIGYDCSYTVLKCSDYGIPQMRKRIFILCAKGNLNIDLNKMLEFDEIKTPILSKFLGKNFSKDIAYTIRCGGRRSPLGDKHNWDGYLVDGKEYRLTVEDCLKLQGFENFKLIGSESEKFKMLGNTIPTNLTKLLGERLTEYYTNPDKYTIKE
jgi:DNA (cytosine-5)-methyltransferase 1